MTDRPASDEVDALDAALALIVALRHSDDDAAMNVVHSVGGVPFGPHNLAIAAAQIAGHAILEVARLRMVSPQLVDAAALGFVRQFAGARAAQDG